MKAEERSGEINSVKSCICGTIGVCLPPCNAAVLLYAGSVALAIKFSVGKVQNETVRRSALLAMKF